MSDLISRQDTLKLLCEKCTEGLEVSACGKWKCIEYRLIEDMPSADRPTGEWIEMGENEDGTHNVKCNQCDSAYKMRGHARSINTRYKYRFCPHCGADMKGADDE